FGLGTALSALIGRRPFSACMRRSSSWSSLGQLLPVGAPPAIGAIGTVGAVGARGAAGVRGAAAWSRTQILASWSPCWARAVWIRAYSWGASRRVLAWAQLR